jgi:hypothetical protein
LWLSAIYAVLLFVPLMYRRSGASMGKEAMVATQQWIVSAHCGAGHVPQWRAGHAVPPMLME